MKQLIVILLFITQVTVAQKNDTLDLFRCLDAVENNYPKAGKKPLIDKQTRLKIKNLKARWYPNLDLNAQASYQSDVATIDMDLPFEKDFPSPSKDQYKVTMDINQMIYDGGVVESSMEMERIGKEISRQSVAVDLYQVKNQVLEVYFGVMLLEKQQKILRATRKELVSKIASVRSAVDNGVLLPSDLKNLQAEELRLEQNMEDLESQIQTSYEILNELTGLKTDTSTQLALPEVTMEDPQLYKRPENKLFQLKKQQFEAQKGLLESQKMPKVYAFGQLGYGKPGLNMLSDKFDTFCIVGAKFTWNLWDWNQNKRKRQVAQIQKDMVDVQEKSFNKSLDVKMERIEADIAKYEKTLIRDRKIVRLRQEVISSARSKLENGVITSSDYITDLNQLTKSRINRERHVIELIKAKLNYLFTTGKI